jgi:glycerol dehydrogenase-like iron-containing ADH family enzyme
LTAPGDPNIEIVIAKDAAARMAGRLAAAGWQEALVVADANTQEAAAGCVASELRSAGIATSEIVFEERSGLTAEAHAIARVRSALTPGLRAIAVGSGVITDIVRYASYLEDRVFVSVPTAASVDGYASSVAALEVDGVKVTRPARAPEAIFADPRVIAAAPTELARAGIGDLLGKATAHVDWLVAHLLYGEVYSATIAAGVIEQVALVADQVEPLLHADPAASETLLRALIRSELAIAAFGNSRPASGCEHHASHFWDLLAARGMRAHAAHGLQVGYASRLAMKLQRFAFAGGVSMPRRPLAPADPLGTDARAWLGEPTRRSSRPWRRSSTSSPWCQRGGRPMRPRGARSAPRWHRRSSTSTRQTKRSPRPASQRIGAIWTSTRERCEPPFFTPPACGPATRRSTSSSRSGHSRMRSTTCLPEEGASGRALPSGPHLRRGGFTMPCVFGVHSRAPTLAGSFGPGAPRHGHHPVRSRYAADPQR